MENLRKIIFKVTEENFGTPFPLIEDETIMILFQNGEAKFAKYHKATIENPFPVFSHPKNVKMLKYIALEIVKNDDPDHLKSENALHFVCPEEFIDKLMW